MKLLIPVCTSLLLIGWVWRTFRSSPHQTVFLTGLFAKIIGGFFIRWLYFNHYGSGDTIQYWLDARLIAQHFSVDPVSFIKFCWDDQWVTEAWTQGLVYHTERSMFFTKTASWVALLCSGDYWLMAIVFSTLSFAGAWYLFRRVITYFPNATPAASISLLFWPSVVVWSSGLIKESLGLGALFFLTGVLLNCLNKRSTSWWEWGLAALCLWIGWNLKYYWFGIWIPVVITTWTVARIKMWRPDYVKYELIGWVGVFATLLILVTSLHPNFYPSRFVEVIYQNHHDFISLSGTNSAIHYSDFEPTVGSLLLNSPWALFSGIYRPFVTESYNVLSALAAMENLVLMILTAWTLPVALKAKDCPFRLLTMACIVYVVLEAVFLALSTPNLGTLSRYKIGFLPFLVFLLLHNNDWLRRQWVRIAG